MLTDGLNCQQSTRDLGNNMEMSEINGEQDYE